jgi:hypothetical protein
LEASAVAARANFCTGDWAPGVLHENDQSTFERHRQRTAFRSHRNDESATRPACKKTSAPASVREPAFAGQLHVARRELILAVVHCCPKPERRLATELERHLRSSLRVQAR